MHEPMSWGGHSMGRGDGHQMSVPMIPAPAAFFAMMFGVMIGVMIGRRKAMMHGMSSGTMGSGMMGHGIMHGMESGMKCGDGGWDDWASRKKMVMGKMSEHHHHGEGSPACCCGHDVPSGAAPASGE